MIPMSGSSADAELTAHEFPLNTVILPTRNGNQIPESAGVFAGRG